MGCIQIHANEWDSSDSLSRGLFPFAGRVLGEESGGSILAAGAAGICWTAYGEWRVDQSPGDGNVKNALSEGIAGRNAEPPNPVSRLGGEKGEWGEG